MICLRQILEAAGVGFIDDNGGGPGVRLTRRSSSFSAWDRGSAWIARKT